ncbi:hypothetical protein ASZ90_019753 [hydrocarbon metagenome]|uniref:GtrA/DPMS transmembrane domain-containing protein n=1 Tax=hydrocarbon metagenome TaxID=938273 RepID=A0A0W8E2J3_9ZZZZ
MNQNELEKIVEEAPYIPHKYMVLFRDIFKYGLVSSVALVVDVGLLYILVEFWQVHYLQAATMAFICGLLVNYTLGRILVFKKSRLQPMKEFIWYSLIGLVGLGLNDLIIYVLVLLSVWYMYAKAISVAVVFFFHFFARRSLFEH